MARERSASRAACGTKEPGEDKPPLRPDIYVALVCAAGTDLTIVKDQLRAQLAMVGYATEIIKVSKVLADALDIDTSGLDEAKRMRTLMRAGDALRAKSEEGEGVGALIVSEIRRLRSDDSGSPNATAYIIDSLKNPAEVELLDRVYGRNYYTVAVYLPKETRLENLTDNIATSLREPPGKRHKKIAKKLINFDDRAGISTSQNVDDTFPRADYFMDGSISPSNQVRRFIQLVFGEPFITPNLDEYCMFMAKAAAYRSNDLSRQVGAVIVDQFGAVVATGSNEVPYPGGGFFYEGRADGIGDNRDYKKKRDPNYTEISRSLIELMGILQKANIIAADETPEKTANDLLHGQYKEMMSNARVRNLIEFGRVVHAEMHALSQAAALGKAVAGGTLYCTTFPCHGCARHIIAAGISKVVYIEPYPKSLTVSLYRDEIRFAHEVGAGDSRVTFSPFHGIAPVLYQRVFQIAHRRRKRHDGTTVNWQPLQAEPVGAAFGVERPQLELSVSSSLADVIDAAKKAFESAEGTKDATKHHSRADSTRPPPQSGVAASDPRGPPAGDSHNG